MTLEEKKKIAEWMGWEFGEDEHGNTFFKVDILDKNSWIYSRSYNPHKKPVQFREVLANLTIEQSDKVSDKMGLYMFHNKIDAFLELTDPDNMPKVMKVVMEVI